PADLWEESEASVRTHCAELDHVNPAHPVHREARGAAQRHLRGEQPILVARTEIVFTDGAGAGWAPRASAHSARSPSLRPARPILLIISCSALWTRTLRL